MLAGNFFLIGRTYWRFRGTGGIKGLNPTENRVEQRAIGKAAVIAGQAGKIANKKLDEAIKKEDDIEKAQQAQIDAMAIKNE